MKKKLKKASFILRKFAVYFQILAVIPFVVLFYLYSQYDTGVYRINVSKNQLFILIFVEGIVSLVVYFSMRKTLSKFVKLADNMHKSAFEQVDREIILDLVKEEGEVAELARSFNNIIVQLEGNVKELEETKTMLHEVLNKVGKALSSMENFDSLLSLILETSIEALGVKRGAIFFINDNNDFKLKSYYGEESYNEADIYKSVEPYLNWVTNEKSTFILPVVGKKTNSNTTFSPPVVCAPLLYRSKIWGVVCFSGNKSGKNFTEDEISIVHNLSYQIALSFENVQLSKDKERAYFETMSALALAVEARDPYSRGHSEQVGVYAVKIGKSMGLSKIDIQTLRDASCLHDIGKIGIADSILRKEGPLSNEEKEIMKQHPTIGQNIVLPLKTFNHLLDPIRHHHEYLDGSGYPDGLKGDAIPLITRIMVVADIYDALNGDRPYRKAFTQEEIKEELDKLTNNNKIDKEVVRHLYETLEAGEVVS